MAEYLSGGIYFSGIGNGTNFSEIVDKLKEVEAIPQKRLESWKSDWKVRYDAFSEVIKTMREAQTKLASINNPQKFITKKATSSKTDILSATANAKALDGNHSIEVKQMASNSIWAFNGSYASKNTSINTTNTTQKFSYTYKNTTREMDIPPGTTLESLSNLINKDSQNPGVRMNIIQSNGAVSFQIMGKDTGADARLTVHPNNLDGMSGGTSVWSSPIGNPNDPFTAPGGSVKYTVLKDGVSHEFTVPATGNLEDLVDQINGSSLGSTTAKIVVRDGKDTLVLADGVTAEGRGLNGTVTNTEKSVYTISSAGQVLDPTATPPDADLVYSYKDKNGKSYSVTMKSNQTMGELVAAFNNVPVKDRPADWPAGGVASLTTKDGQTRIELAEGFSGLSGTNIPAVTKEVIRSEWASEVDPTRPLDNVRFSMVDGDGTSHTLDLNGSSTLAKLADAINDKLNSKRATIVTGTDGKSRLELTNIRSLTGEDLKGNVASSDKWSIQESQNAIFKVDNWPNDVESASNTVKDVIEGVEFTIMGEGKSQITIQSDTSSVKKNIQEYLDAVNSVVKVMQDLSKVDEVNNANGETYTSKSQFAKASGSALTGNYGTQLLNSRMKSLTTGVPAGFTRIEGTDVLSGDLVASLAQMGIKTCTQEGDPNYGLFMIAPPSTSKEMQALDQEKFDKYMKDNMDDVVNLFSADEIARSSSPNFHYSSHIKGMAKPGNYEVSYSVNADGTMGDVFINGAKAKPAGNGVYTADETAGNARSMAIQIDNMTPGLNFTGTISIQQGKVGEMESFLTSELRYNEKDTERNGSIMILQANYKGIMNNIDKKIEKEEERIMKWERTKRLEFSRLETLLGQYERQMTSMQSQMAGLTSSS